MTDVETYITAIHQITDTTGGECPLGNVPGFFMNFTNKLTMYSLTMAQDDDDEEMPSFFTELEAVQNAYFNLRHEDPEVAQTAVNTINQFFILINAFFDTDPASFNHTFIEWQYVYEPNATADAPDSWQWEKLHAELVDRIIPALPVGLRRQISDAAKFLIPDA